jgi:hypothetical protein
LALHTELELLVQRHGPASSSNVTSPNTLNSRSKVSCGVLPAAPPAALETCPRVAAALLGKLRSQEKDPQFVGADERALIRSEHAADQAFEHARIRTGAHHSGIQLRRREQELPLCVVIAPQPEWVFEADL